MAKAKDAYCYTPSEKSHPDKNNPSVVFFMDMFFSCDFISIFWYTHIFNNCYPFKL